MNSLYLNEYTLGFLAQLILTVMLTVYLLSLRNKTTATWWLLLFFAGLTAYAAVSFYKEASLGIGSFYAAHVQVVLMVLAMVPMLQLAYRYPRDPRAAGPVGPSRREAIAVLVISLLAVAVSLIWANWVIAHERLTTTANSEITSTAMASRREGPTGPAACGSLG